METREIYRGYKNVESNVWKVKQNLVKLILKEQKDKKQNNNKMLNLPNHKKETPYEAKEKLINVPNKHVGKGHRLLYVNI